MPSSTEGSLIVINDEGTSVTLSFNRTYPYNEKQRAIEGYTSEGEYWCVYSVFISGVKLEADQTILDTNNCPQILETLEEKGVVTRTGMIATSGFCQYPIVAFTDRMLSTFQQAK